MTRIENAWKQDCLLAVFNYVVHGNKNICSGDRGVLVKIEDFKDWL